MLDNKFIFRIFVQIYQKTKCVCINFENDLTQFVKNLDFWLIVIHKEKASSNLIFNLYTKLSTLSTQIQD